jgi:phosphohistidine phosphatase
MRTLVLLRHAKAETPGEKPDFERDLAARGRRDATAAGTWPAKHGLYPDMVICSPAARTRQTWHQVAVALAQAAPEHAAPQVRYDPGLYEGGRTEVIDALRAVPDDARTVLVVGHNPTMSDVSVLLRPDDADPDWPGLKTAGLAVHRTDRSWADTEPGSLELVRTQTARG